MKRNFIRISQRKKEIKVFLEDLKGIHQIIQKRTPKLPKFVEKL